MSLFQARVYTILQNMKFILVSPLFSLGLISTAGPLDREAGNPFVFNIYAIDVVPAGQSHHTGTAVVSVDIIDVNDNTPAFTKPTYAFTVPETIAVGAIAGQVQSQSLVNQGLSQCCSLSCHCV